MEAFNIFYTDINDGADIDYSKYDYPRDIWRILPTWEVAVKSAFFAPVILFGSIGNFILLYIIYKNRGLRTPTNLLIANMAFADFLTVLVPPLLFMFHNFYQNYVLGSLGCKLEGFLLGSLTITAVLNLCAVSYDRLTAIVLPSETRISLFGAKIVMTCTWVFGILMSLPLSIFRTYRERQWKNFLETYCRENQNILPIYWHVIISALVWVPLVIMVLCYSSIFWKLDRYEKEVLKREHPISVSYKRKVARSLFIIVITFVLLRLPFTAMVFIRNDWVLSTGGGTSLSNSFYILWYTSHYLMFFNAAINPVIYGMTNDNFRRAFHQTPGLGWLCRTKGQKDNPTSPERRLFNEKLQPRCPIGNQNTWLVFSKKNGPGATSVMSRTTKVSVMKSTVNIDATESQHSQTGGGAGANKRTNQKISSQLESTDSVKQTDTVITSNGFI